MLPTYAKMVPLFQIEGRPIHEKDCLSTTPTSLLMNVKTSANRDGFIWKWVLLIVLPCTIWLQ